MSKYDAQYEAWKKKKAEEAQAASSAKRDQHEKQYQEWKAKQDNSATNHAGIIQKRVNNWISNNNNYVTNYKNRFMNRTGSYKDAYADNAEGWLTDTQRHKAQLDQDAEDILSMLDTYGDQLDADWVKDVRNVMSEARKNQGSILDAFTADRDYWAQFDSKDSYEEWQRFQPLVDYDSISKTVQDQQANTDSLWEEAQAAEKAYRDAAAKLQTPDRRLTDEEYAAAEAELDELFNTMHEANAQYNRAKTDLDYYSYYYDLAKEKHDLEALPEGYDPTLAAKGWESYTADQARKQEEKAEDAALKGLANLFAGVSDTSGFAVATREMATGFREDTSYKEPSEKWTDAQRNKFGYLYQQNPQTAEEYAIKINDAIAREEKEGVISGIQANASSGFWPGLGHSAAALAAGGLGIADYYVDLLEYGVRGRITEKPGVTPFEYSQAVTSGISQKLNKKGTLDEGLFAIGGKGWGDLYSLGISAAQSMLSAYTLGGTGSMVQFFGSAAASGVDDAKQRGATDEQALIYGTLMGAAEAYAEKCGIDNLLSLSPGETVRQLITNILKQGAQEGMEEGLTSVLGGVADQLVLGDNSNFNALVRQYRADGMSAEEAKRQAWKDTAGDVIFDAIGGAFTGAVSGGVHTGIATAVQNYQDTKSGKKIVETKGGTDALMQLAREMAEREYGSTKETINTLAEKAGAGDARSSGKLLRTVEAAAYKRNQSEIAKNLQDNGISAKQAKEIAEAVNASLAGFRITEKQTRLLETVASDERVTSAVDRVLGSGRSGVLQRTRMLNNFAQKLESGKQTANTAAAQQTQAQAENTATVDNVTTTEKTAPEGGYEVSAEGQTVLKESGDAVSIKRVADIRDGKVMLELEDGQEVSARDIAFEDEAHAEAFSAVADIENITPAGATAIIGDVDFSKPVVAQINGMGEAYNYGFYGYSVEDLKADGAAEGLTDEQITDAYRQGQSVRETSDAEADAPAEKMRAAAGEEMTAGQKARIESNDTEVYFLDGKTVTKFDEHRGRYDKKRKAAVNTAKFLSKLGIGSKYYFYESYVNASRVRVYKDADGNEVEAPNGMYMDDGSIYIDLNAGDYGQGTALFTLGHELTHFIKAQSKKQFKILCDLVTEAYSKTDMSMHERVVAKQDLLSAKRGRHVTHAEAYEEVVADAMSTMLSDGSFHEKIMEIKVKDKGLFNTIKRFFEKMIAKFRKAYADLTPDQRDARDIQEMKDLFDNIQTAFVEALVEASENFQAAETNNNTAANYNEIRYMDREGKVKAASQLSEHDLSALLDKVENRELSNDSYVPLRATTPQFFIDVVDAFSDGRVCIKNLPMAATVKHIIQNMEEEDGESYGKHRPHGLSKDDIITISKEMGHPSYIVLQKNGRYAEVVSFYNSRKKRVVISIDYADAGKNYKYQQYMNGYDAGYYNIIVTEYEPDSLKSYLDGCKIIYDKTKMNGKYQVGSGRVVTFTHDTPFNISVTREESTVNKKFSDREAALEHFGRTYSWKETGYLLTNGAKLDFSGRHEGASGGYRTVDHREILDIYPEDTELDGNGAMVDFMKQGNIRIMPEGNGINLSVKPTKAQEQALDDFISKVRGEVTLDIDDERGYTIVSVEYPRFTRASRVIQDIRNYFESGVEPTISQVAKFRNQDRLMGSVSNRDLLANALESVTQNSIEYQMIQEYKGRIRLINEYEEKLAKLNAEIRQIRFGTKGKRDTERLKQLETEARTVAANINRNDRKLLSLEASEPLRKVIAQERKKEAQRVKKHVKEIQENKKTRAEQAELRRKIRRAVRDLDRILNRGDKKRNVKEDMKGFASKALELADYLFTDHISNEDLIRNGITVRMTPTEAQLVKETEDILSRLYDHTDSLTNEEFTELDAKRRRNLEKLSDLLVAQRNERLNTPVYNLFNDLVTEYASLKNSKQNAVKAAYDPEVERFLRSYIGEANGETDSDRKTLLQNMRVVDMTAEELWKLYNAYQMVLHSVRNANTLFVKGKAESIGQIADSIIHDFGKRKVPQGKMATIARNLSNKVGWDYEKLHYALDRIGSTAFTELVMNIANSENTVMQDVKEATVFRDEMVEKYGFNDWDVNKEIDRDFLDNTGKKFKLTLGQLMALYAYSRREGAWDHIEYGGFVFGEAALTNPKPADSYKLTKEQCEAITSLLTKEQKDYVEDMQKFLSETMGEKGNEVSMLLYGIKMFGEKNYFPIHIAGQFKAQANESQAKAVAGFSSMSNAGFTHAQNPNAKAPFVLEGFNEIWTDHVNEMSRYHGTVPALEDMRRVMNRSSYSEADAESMAIKQLMENSYGREAVQYFDNLYREANSGAITDKLQKNSKWLLSMFRKNSVAYSLSVLIQQPASIVRAYAMIPKKYFGIKGFGAITTGTAKAVTSKWNPAYASAYNEMLKYAPGVTMAKEIGGFDTATGGSIRSYLLDTNKKFSQKWKTGTITEKGKAILDKVDNNVIANLPNVADKIAWIEIWNACKREAVATHKYLAPNSEPFMQVVGERFTEVIRATQVYDSIFAKSPMLKSKNLAVQYLVSFMNEPNTVANMAESAVRDAARGDWKGGAKKAAVLIHSIIFTNLLKSLIYAMRDDDEDETYIEKYIEAVVGNMMSDLNALNYIPLARDAWSLAQGYDVERADMAIVADAIDALNRVIKNATADTEGMTEEQLAEFDKKCTEATWRLVESMASFFGIAVKNIRREIKAVIDHARIATANAGLTTGLSARDAFHKAVADSVPFVLAKESKQDKLYRVILSGDEAYLARLKSSYKSDDAYHSAIRTGLRNNEPRIREAAIAWNSGENATYMRIAKEILKEKHFVQDDVVLAIRAEADALKKDSSSSASATSNELTSFFTMDTYLDAVMENDREDADIIKTDMIQTAVANGDSQEEAEKDFSSSFVTKCGKAYQDGELTSREAATLLEKYGDLDREEADEKVQYWVFKEEYPAYDDMSQSAVTKYYGIAEPAGVGLAIYAEYRERAALVEGEDRKETCMKIIDSLPLTNKQKDALYFVEGWAESKLYQAPWH